MEFVNKILHNKKQLLHYFPEPDSSNRKNPEAWFKLYQSKAEQSLPHDEPWLTLIALYSIFGDQQNIEATSVNALNMVLRNGGLKHIQFSKVTEITVEKKLPEIQAYREYLYKSTFSKGAYHPYSDKKKTIASRLKKKTESLEGSTNLDVFIKGELKKGEEFTLYIEAKFLSDLSKDISYNPVRNQIIRNIDAAIQEEEGKGFAFLLLTPGIFRPAEFGKVVRSPLQKFNPQTSRLYCYKMLEYKNWKNLQADLPHLKESDTRWKIISSNIGWITFEDILHAALEFNTIQHYSKEILRFFKDRELE